MTTATGNDVEELIAVAVELVNNALGNRSRMRKKDDTENPNRHAERTEQAVAKAGELLREEVERGQDDPATIIHRWAEQHPAELQTFGEIPAMAAIDGFMHALRRQKSYHEKETPPLTIDQIRAASERAKTKIQQVIGDRPRTLGEVKGHNIGAMQQTVATVAHFLIKELREHGAHTNPSSMIAHSMKRYANQPRSAAWPPAVRDKKRMETETALAFLAAELGMEEDVLREYVALSPSDAPSRRTP